MEFKAYHKIKQFSDVVKSIKFNANYKGKDEEGNPIYEESEKPVLTFVATTKLHGTNAGICYTPEKGLVAQKRSCFLSKYKSDSHFGFSKFVYEEKRDFFTNLMQNIYKSHCSEGDQITLYGEWAGKGIQKSVGISELTKAFYVFDCKIYNKETDAGKWLDITDWRFDTDKVYNVHEFKTWKLDIDFNNPGHSQNKLIEITEEIENECPVSKSIGNVKGTGEGAVWTAFWKGEKYIFKVKGEKHSSSKVNKLASVDPEVLKSIDNFVDYACTPNRIEQGIQETNATEKYHIPLLLKWVANDIIQEETDTLIANDLEWKQVARNCNDRVKRYYFAKLNKI